MDLVTYTADRLLPVCIEILSPVFGGKARAEAMEALACITGSSVLKIRLGSESILLSETERDMVIDACRRRAAREPIQYITGKAFFMYDEFVVGPKVLIPRADTERLVEKAVEICLKLVSETSDPCGPVRFIEFCTGSGCVSVSFVKAVMNAGGHASGVASDISDEALSYAGENIRRLGMGEFIETVRHDMLSGNFDDLADRYGDFDLLIINPPYIPSDVISGLEPEVCANEPRIALDGGADGLDFYRAAVQASFKLLRNGGYLTAETGYDQAGAVAGILEESALFCDIRAAKDHSGHYRVVSARMTGRKH